MLVSLIIIASLTIPVNTVDAKQSILEPLLANKLTKKKVSLKPSLAVGLSPMRPGFDSWLGI